MHGANHSVKFHMFSNLVETIVIDLRDLENNVKIIIDLHIALVTVHKMCETMSKLFSDVQWKPF